MGQIYTTGSQASSAGASAAAAVGGAAVSGLFGIAQQQIQRNITADDRRENYEYNEMAAENADQRTRALYNDFYSPEALLKQYKAAGLSPSMMFGGTPGQGGMSGAQGGGPAGPGTPYVPKSLLEGAQIANIIAQTNKIKAETTNIQSQTQLNELEQEYNQMRNNIKSVEFQLATAYAINDDGTTTSFYNLAESSYDYDQFINTCKKIAPDDIKIMIDSEEGQKTMRSIYMSANRFERDIKVLSEEGISAEFQKQILQCLKNKDFANQNAETAIKQLQAAGEAADLTKEQKGAFNNIIESLRKKNSTAADILIVACMIFNQAASNWKAPTIKIGKE